MQIFSRDIGLDIGTSNTRVFLPKRGVVYEGPSVVALNEEGEVVAFGKDAKDMLGRAPSGVNVHEILKNGAIEDHVIAEKYLSYVLRGVRSAFQILKPDIVVSFSSNTTSIEQRAIVEVCKKIGARRVFPEQKIILASLGVGITKEETRGRMLADIGGGTTEAAVISLGGLLDNTSVAIGGKDLDYALIKYIKDRYSINISRTIASKIKIEIGTLDGNKEEKSIKVKGSDLSTGLPKVVRVSSSDFLNAVQKEVKGMVDSISSIFFNTPPEITSDIVEKGIILTGGLAHLDGMAAYISNSVGVPVKIATDPSHSVIRGIGKLIKLGYFDYHKRALLSK